MKKLTFVFFLIIALVAAVKIISYLAGGKSATAFETGYLFGLGTLFLGASLGCYFLARKAFR